MEFASENDLVLERGFKIEMSSESTTGCCLVFAIMYWIAQIAIGAVYLDQCPIQPYIPVYLLVLGCFCMGQNVLSWCLGRDNVISVIWNLVTGLFILCWFITGNVWIYSIYEPNYDRTLMLEANSTNSTSAQYCDKTVYLFAFWTTTLVYIIPLLSLPVYCVFCLCGLACTLCFNVGGGDQGAPGFGADTMGAEGPAAVCHNVGGGGQGDPDIPAEETMGAENMGAEGAAAAAPSAPIVSVAIVSAPSPSPPPPQSGVEGV